jgi:hypothetical protein
VAGLPPLYDRIKFESKGGFVNPRQPQLELKPFDAPRLQEVALKLRQIYPTPDPTGLAARVTPQFIERLVARVTAGFKGDVGVVPRQFLRQFINVLDLTSEYDDYDPMAVEGFDPDQLTEDEIRVRDGLPPYTPEPEDETGYAVVEF